MMKKVLLLISLFISLLPAFAQTEPMPYHAVMNRFTQFYNRNQADSVFSMFSAEVKAGMPLEKNRQMIGQLQTQSGGLKKTTFIGMENNVATYRVDFQKAILSMQISLTGAGKIGGLLFDNYRTGNQQTTATTDDPYTTETTFDVKTLSGSIRGILAMPKQSTGKIPVVLIIASSGPTDRDGNKPKLNQKPDTYKLLAAALAKNSIASLRYDKRLIGESVTTARENQHRFDDYVDDAVALVTKLQEDQRFSKVIVLGHSEGSLVGMLTASSQPVNAFISVEGESLTGDKIMTEQLKNQPDYIKQGFKNIIDTMRRGKINDKVDPALYSVARVSVQPYLMTWMRFDPLRELKKLKIPVLLLQGNNDLQVGIADAEKLKKAKSDAKLVIIPGMNYVLKDAPAAAPANIATYNQPELPVKAELVSAVVDFVKGLK